MKLRNFKNLLLFISVIILTLGLSISFQSLLAAWTAPLSNPPACLTGNPGCDAPLNSGPFIQTKSGALWINTDGLSPYGLIVEQGKVGIGTTNPGAKLDVIGRASFTVPNATTNLGGVATSYGVSMSNAIDSTLVFRSLGGGVVHITTDAGGRQIRLGGGLFEQTMTIASGGYVGIGTTGPLAKLDVRGDTGVHKIRADTNERYNEQAGWWYHDPYGYGWGKPHGSFRTLEVSSSGNFSTEPAMFRIHQWGSGAAEFWKPQGTVLYLRETPGGGGGWFNRLELQASMNLTGNLGINGNQTLYLGREEVFGGGDTGGADYGYIRWDNDNNTYAYWGDSGENGALVIGSQNDGRNLYSDVVALQSPAAIFLDAPETNARFIYDLDDRGYYMDPNGTSNLNLITNRTRATMGNSGLYNTPRHQITGDTRYWTGAMGWGTTDFNAIYSNWGSGFFDTWSNPGNAPGGSSHYVGLQAFHFNHGDNTNAYGFQMAMAGEANNRFFLRSGWPAPRPWVEILHSGNIGSFAVGNADTVDGYHLNQALLTSSSPTFAGLTTTGRYYSNEWIQMNNYSGLYSPLNGAHFYPNNASYGSWRIAGSRNGWQGLEFDAAGGQLSLMMGHTSQGWGGQQTGIHNNSYGWLWRFDHNTLAAGNVPIARIPDIGSASVNYATSAGNADTVDGWHRDDIRANATGGSVGYANSAGNADTVDGYHLSVAGSANTIPTRNGSGYLIPENWTQLNGYYGLYSPNNGAHFYPNNASYGAWRVAGSRNGWGGLEFDSAGGQLSLMMNQGNGWGAQYTGVHNNSYGWLWYSYHTSLYAAGFNCTSDEKLKRDIYKIDNALTKLNSIDGVYFNWRDETNGKGRQAGVISQNVEKVLPEVVNINIDGYKTVDYSKLSPLIIEAVKELDKKTGEDIQSLKNQIDTLQTRIEQLEKRNKK